MHLAQHVLPAYGGRAVELLQQFDAAASELISSGKAPSVDPALAPYFPAAHAELLRDLYRLDPTAAAAQVRGPVLVFSGRLDPEIPLTDGQLLAAALVHAKPETIVGPSTGHNLEVLPDMAADPGHAAQMARITVPDTDLGAVNGIVDWVGRTAAGH